MSYTHIETGAYPLTEREIRNLFPNTSFPAPFQPPGGYALVFPAPQPEHDPITQVVREAAPVMTDKGHWEQRWEVVDLLPEVVEANQAKKVEADLLAAKLSRHSLVAAITVTAQSGRVFDGNEDAQNRMSRAITAMDDGDELPWVLSDNTVALVGKAEMREALRLSGAAMAAIWVAPYAGGEEA